MSRYAASIKQLLWVKSTTVANTDQNPSGDSMETLTDEVLKSIGSTKGIFV